MKPIVPMEPKSSEIIPLGEEWIAQVKWDGVRVLTYYDGAQASLYNRKLRERTHHYPEICNVRSYCKSASVILDGEIIALGPDGKPSFREVMRRDGLRRMDRVQGVQKVVPITYMVFDILFHDGRWVHQLPLQERMALLAQIIEPQPYIQLVSSHREGKGLFQTVKEHGMEGVVFKQLHSSYYMQQKKDVWLKVKNLQDLIAVVAGFTLKDNIINALLLGLYDEAGHLWYIGHVGTGKLSKQEWRDLTNRLRPLIQEEQPFVHRPNRHQDAIWARPVLTVKVQYAEWTEGHSLRQPSIQAFVEAEPRECLLP